MSYGPQPYLETGPGGKGDFNDHLQRMGEFVSRYDTEDIGRLRFGALAEVVAHAEILFVAVQTPHDPRFGGETPLRESPVDFDYTFLKDAVRKIAKVHDGRDLPMAVISTVLPGTMAREIVPLIHETGLKLVYNPHFIAMGTVMQDFLNPEFVLLGVDDPWAADVADEFYRSVFPNWIEEATMLRRMSVASAELTKVAYNTYISTKIGIANTLMEICHKTPGADIDDVTGALRCATKRVASGAYMDGGMGDGGGCHPRDNIALSWLAKKLELSYDPFEAAMLARERQSGWLARVCYGEYIKARAARIVVAGYAFKPGTNITAGSPALLLAAQIKEAFGVQVEMWDPHVKADERRRGFHYRSNERVVVLIGCKHPEFEGWTGEGLGDGSVVVDPHRITGRSFPGIKIIRVGDGAQDR